MLADEPRANTVVRAMATLCCVVVILRHGSEGSARSRT
jgi:hypothetical protein